MSGLRRLFQIGLAVGGYLLWWLLVRLHLWRPSVTPAQRLCRTFERLGTTFVKLGQGLSLHRYLLPDEYIHALQSLQDRVTPFTRPSALSWPVSSPSTYGKLPPNASQPEVAVMAPASEVPTVMSPT